MKQVVTNYSFSTTGKTVTLTDFGVSHPVDLKRLYLITDVTTNKVLYNFADSSVASAAVSSNNVITLSTLQGGESNTDSLQIIYDVLPADPTYQTPLLPSNAAQETGGNLASIATNTTGVATAANQATGNSSLTTIATNTTNTSTAGSYVRQDSNATIAKESGGNLAAAKADLDTLAGTVSGGKVLTTETNSSAIKTDLDTIATQTNGVAIASKQPGFGTAGTPSANVVSVQGVSSMTPLKTDGSATTQPVSAAALPLPTGAATSAKQPALGTAGSASSDVLSIQGIPSMTPVKTDGSATTQPVSATALPLPSGASTSAKQPALGTAGTASTDVLTVQGIASMTALKVDGSGVTQPVSSASASGSAVPSGLFPMGINNGGNLAFPLTTADSGATISTTSSALLFRVVAEAYIYNGTAFEKQSTVNAVANTTGTGLLGVGALGFDGTNYRRLKTDTSGNVGIIPTIASTGGATPYSLISASGTNATNVKSSAGTLYSLVCMNTSASARYVRLFNLAVSPTVGTSTPAFRFLVPAGGGFTMPIPAQGVAFGTGIAFDITGGAADTDTTSVAASDVMLNLVYA